MSNNRNTTETRRDLVDEQLQAVEDLNAIEGVRHARSRPNPDGQPLDVVVYHDFETADIDLITSVASGYGLVFVSEFETAAGTKAYFTYESLMVES